MNVYVKAALYTLIIMATGVAIIGGIVWVIATLGLWSIAVFGGIVLFTLIFVGVLDELETEAKKKAKANPGRETDY